MKYAIINQEMNSVINVVGTNSGLYNTTPSARRIQLNANEWCQPGAVYSATGTPRFTDVSERRWTSYQFLNRLTPQERQQIRNKAKTDDNVADFEMLATAAQEIISTDPMTIAGMDYLVSINILTQARRNQILGP